ncbi:MAG TPA: hypothetical protein VGD74_12915, partial [Vulgatibacter sp.]
MKRRWAIRFLVFVCGTVGAVVLVLRTEWAARQLCQRAEQAIARILAVPFSIESCEIDPLRATVVARGLRLGSGEGGALPELTIERVGIDLSSIALGRAFAVHSIELDRPEVIWTQGTATEGGPEGGGEGCLSILDSLKVDALRIRDGKVVARLDPGTRTIRAEAIDLEVERRRGRLLPSFRQGDPARTESYLATLRLGGGSFEEADSAPVVLDGFEAEVELSPVEETLRIKGVSARLPGLEVDAFGSIRRICDPILGLSVSASGDLAKVGALAGADSLSGAFFANAKVEGPAGTPEVEGTLDLEAVDLDGYAFGDLVARFRAADGHLLVDELTWPIGDGRARITADLSLE